MTPILRIDPRAYDEAESVARWYEERRTGHGGRFRQEFDHVLSRIQEHPKGFQAIEGQVRRAFTRQFPFVVVYRITQESIQVVGVVPTQADPTVVTLMMDARMG